MAAAAVVILLALAGCQKPRDLTATHPLGTLVRQEPWLNAFGQGELLTTQHYRIFTSATRRDLVEALPPFMEAAHQRYLQVTGLGETAGPPLPVYMMETRPQWVALTREIVKENLDLYLSIQAGGYCYRRTCVFWDIGGIAPLSIAAHEGLHQFLSVRLRDSLPMFLEEGICTTLEGVELRENSVTFTPNRNIARMDNLRRILVDGPWVDLGSLLKMDAGDAVADRRPGLATGYYCQLWALACFIQARPQYRQGLQRLMADAAAGNLASQLGFDRGQWSQLRRDGRRYNKTIAGAVFQHYISRDLGGFEKEYRRFACQLVGIQ